jgi:hypothetical protein
VQVFLSGRSFVAPKGAVRLEKLFDHEEDHPKYAHVTEEKVHEVNVFKKPRFFPWTIAVFVLGFVDYQFFLSGRRRACISLRS